MEPASKRARIEAASSAPSPDLPPQLQREDVRIDEDRTDVLRIVQQALLETGFP